MSRIAYLIAGAFFGTLLYKSELVSWFRIQEMFRFQSFHLYGVLMCGVAVGAISLWMLRHHHVRSATGEAIVVPNKQFNHGAWIGGIIFGMGWALTGSCPGPLWAHVGIGTTVMLVALFSAIAGTWVYAQLRPRLPH